MLRDTTSRGVCVRVRPPHTSERRGGGGGCEQLRWLGAAALHRHRHASATTLRLISLSPRPRGILQWPEEQSRSGCGQDGGNTDQSQHRRLWPVTNQCRLHKTKKHTRCQWRCPSRSSRGLSTHPCAPLTSLPTFLLTTSPSPAPLTSVRWPDSNVQAAAGRVP